MSRLYRRLITKRRRHDTGMVTLGITGGPEARSGQRVTTITSIEGDYTSVLTSSIAARIQAGAHRRY